MDSLIPNPRAPLLLYMCPNCLLLFLGRGYSLQLCPNCHQDLILSLTTDSAIHLLKDVPTYCPDCRIVLNQQSETTKCLLNAPNHNPAYIPKEIFTCLSDQALKDASKLQSVGSDTDTQLSLLSHLPQEESTTPSSINPNTKPDSSTSPLPQTE